MHEHRHGHRHEARHLHQDQHADREHGRHGHGRRGSGRIFDHGELRLVTLALIAEAPRHGYEIIKVIEDRLAGSYSPSPGVIYPTLTMLEELGHATVAEIAGKKQHTITPEGQAWLTANRPAVDAAMARMQAVGAMPGPAPQIVRAMENLKLALRLRERRGPLTEDKRRAIAETLDAAAVTIERA